MNNYSALPRLADGHESTLAVNAWTFAESLVPDINRDSVTSSNGKLDIKKKHKKELSHKRAAVVLICRLTTRATEQGRDIFCRISVYNCASADNSNNNTLLHSECQKN